MQHHPNAHAPRNQGHLARPRIEHPALGVQPQAALLRHDQQLAVRAVEHPLRHGAIGQVQVDADAGLQAGIAIGRQGHQAVHEILRRARHGHG